MLPARACAISPAASRCCHARLPINAQVLRGNVERVELARQCQVNQQGGQQADSRRDGNGETAHRRGARCDLPVQGTAHVREQGAD